MCASTSANPLRSHSGLVVASPESNSHGEVYAACVFHHTGS